MNMEDRIPCECVIPAWVGRIEFKLRWQGVSPSIEGLPRYLPPSACELYVTTPGGWCANPASPSGHCYVTASAPIRHAAWFRAKEVVESCLPGLIPRQPTKFLLAPEKASHRTHISRSAYEQCGCRARPLRRLSCSPCNDAAEMSTIRPREVGRCWSTSSAGRRRSISEFRRRSP